MTTSSAQTAKPWEHAKAGEGSATDALAARFVQSLTYDRRLYKHDIQGSIAHARMLKTRGLITQDDLAQIERGLAEIREEIDACAKADLAAGVDDAHGLSWPGWKLELEDVHMCIEAALTAKVGDAGRKLHTGRSRNDQVALDLVLWLHEAAGQVGGLINRLMRAFVTLAERDGNIVMPSYTHLQRAQPIVAGGELMAWIAAFDRARRRLDLMIELNHRNPLGSGAIAGSSLPLDRAATAGALGVGEPTLSSIDGTASRDAAIDFVYALAMTTMTLSRWAEQWIIYCSTEFSFISMDDRYTTGSSMMPQKRNPDMLELIRGRCGNVYGSLNALLTTLKGLPIGYNRDLQEDKRHLFAAYDITVDCVEMASRIVETTKFNGDKIAATLERGFLDATSLAEYLVTRGVPFRTSHQVVGRLVRLCIERGIERLSQLPREEFSAACVASNLPSQTIGADVAQWLDARNVVQRYQSLGNSGQSGFEQQLGHWKSQLKPA